MLFFGLNSLGFMMSRTAVMNRYCESSNFFFKPKHFHEKFLSVPFECGTQILLTTISHPAVT